VGKIGQGYSVTVMVVVTQDDLSHVKMNSDILAMWPWVLFFGYVSQLPYNNSIIVLSHKL
jgi:hypothetical protein